MNRFDPPPDLGNANVGNIDKLLMRANPLAGLPVFLCDKPGKRLPCLHEQTFAGQRTASSEAESWQEASGCRACTSRHLPGNGQRAAKLRAVRYRGWIGGENPYPVILWNIQMKGGNTMREYLENVRNTVPLVHNITNYVTVNDVANVLLACGGSPIMSDEAEDVEDITSVCGGLNINIGTLHKTSIEGMFRAGKKANELGHPVLLDPVGAGASALRTNTVLGLMKELKLAVIRGNISEIKTLALGSGTTKGVDADVADAVTEESLDEAVAFVKKFAEETGTIIAVTGAIDLVSDGRKCYVIRNGRPEMGKITGTGCQLSGMMTAYVTANPDHPLEAAAAAVCVMGLAGEIGWSRMQERDGNATYRNRIIDAIYNMTGEELEKGAKYEIR